jgi:hypothetical protein
MADLLHAIHVPRLAWLCRAHDNYEYANKSEPDSNEEADDYEYADESEEVRLRRSPH